MLRCIMVVLEGTKNAGSHAAPQHFYNMLQGVTNMTMTQTERESATREYLFGDAQVNVSNAIRDSFVDDDWTGIKEALGRIDANPQGQPVEVATLRTLIQRNTDKAYTIKKIPAGKDRIFDVVK